MEKTMKRITLLALVPPKLAASPQAQVQVNPVADYSEILTEPAKGQLFVSTGADYSEGKYGGNVKSKQWTMPLVAKYETNNWMVKASMPYVRIKDVNPNARGESLPCGNAVNTPSDVNGWGDLVATGTYSVVQADGLIIDLGAKVKFATGDEDKCLSSGKNDYSAFMDVAKQFGSFTAFGGFGWTSKGDPKFLGVTTDYRNPFFGSVGGAYKIGGATSVGGSYDYRQRLTSSGDPISELTLFLTHKYSPNLKIQGYAVAGLSNASPDFGAGALVSFGF
jgi:hypothetical protein